MSAQGTSIIVEKATVSRLWTKCPWSEDVTDYDRMHLYTYARLLDNHTGGTSLFEMARLVFGLDPIRHFDHARLVVSSHLERALWMTKHGYALLLW